MKSPFLPPDFSTMVSLYLLNIDLHLLQIARSRACRDFGAVAQEAEDIFRITGSLGALAARAVAHRLKQVCLAENYTEIYGLISELSQACREAETALNDWLALDGPPGKA
jgi:HPt (histidine-containing phosphotransfer) domain-containing protein